MSAAERREDFIDAAIRVVALHGMDKATTRRIAEEAGAPLAALHYCFPSKESLLFAVYERQMVESQKFLVPPRKHTGLGRAAGNLVRGTMEWYRANEILGRAQIELYFWVERENHELGRRVFDLVEAMLAEHLRSAMRPDDDESLVAPLARMIVAQTDGLLLQWIGYRDWERAMADADVAAESLETLAERHRLSPRERTPSRTRTGSRTASVS